MTAVILMLAAVGFAALFLVLGFCCACISRRTPPPQTLADHPSLRQVADRWEGGE